MSQPEPTPRSPTRMARGHRIYLAMSAATVGFLLAFAWPAIERMSVFWYFPLERRWAYIDRPDGLAMDWYGRLFFAAAVGLVVFGAADVIARRLRPPRPRTLSLWAAWVATAALLVMALYAYQLIIRQPVPTPLPDWYQPR